MYQAYTIDPSINPLSLHYCAASQPCLICAARLARDLALGDMLYSFGSLRAIAMIQDIIRIGIFASQLEICVGAIEIHFSVVGLLGNHLS